MVQLFQLLKWLVKLFRLLKLLKMQGLGGFGDVFSVVWVVRANCLENKLSITWPCRFAAGKKLFRGWEHPLVTFSDFDIVPSITTWTRQREANVLLFVVPRYFTLLKLKKNRIASLTMPDQCRQTPGLQTLVWPVGAGRTGTQCGSVWGCAWNESWKAIPRSWKRAVPWTWKAGASSTIRSYRVSRIT